MSIRKSFVFLATLGQTDIQLVTEYEGKQTRVNFNKSCIRKFQSDCISGEINWEIIPFDKTVELKENKRLEAYYNDSDKNVRFIQKSASEIFVPEIMHPPFKLCAPIIARAMQSVKSFQNRQIIDHAVGALLFSTERSETSAVALPAEPIGAFALISGHLAEALEIGITDIRNIKYLTNGDYYQIDRRGSKTVRYDIAETIMNSLRTARSTNGDAERVVISNVGGIPQISQLLAESAYYWYGHENTLFANDSEFNFGRNVPCDCIQISPVELINGRRRIITLLAKGAYEAALKLARVIEDPIKISERQLTEYLNKICKFLTAGDKASFKADTPSMVKYLSLSSSDSPLLRMAFRIESALLRSDPARAILDLFTLNDIAFWEAVEKAFSKPGKSCINWPANCLNLQNCSIELPLEYLAKGKKMLYLGESFSRGSEKPVKLKDFFEKKLPGNFGNALKDFSDVLNPVRSFRNAATHGVISESRLRKSIQALNSAGVWKYQDNTSHMFLDSKYLIDIMIPLGITEPSKLYDDFVASIMSDIGNMPTHVNSGEKNSYP